MRWIGIFLWSMVLMGCVEDSDLSEGPSLVDASELAVFDGSIRLTELDNYENQQLPIYILKDNTSDNPITDAGATLGRVLFYDKNLSVDNSVSCASCHQQAFAFGDTSQFSRGVNGSTERHSMRLVNSRFSIERRFLWDEAATDLEEQTAQPIVDHIEMGFSGRDGNPDLDDLIDKLYSKEYYEQLFTLAFGGEEISKERISQALAQFIRSMQSFDSRFDEGLRQVNDINDPFPNFSELENLGKQIFLLPNGDPQAVGAGCGGCHIPPEFDIDEDSRNNGVIENLNDSLVLNITRAPSLRDVFNPAGMLNGPLMHNGQFETMEQVVEHYNEIPADPRNGNLDIRLTTSNGPQSLLLTDREKQAIVAFLKTLTGSSVYTDPKYSDPF